MTESLELNPGDRVLEIGTGSGYQAAVLAELGFAEIYTIEIVPELAQSAGQRLKNLGMPASTRFKGMGILAGKNSRPIRLSWSPRPPTISPIPWSNNWRKGAGW